MIRIPRPTFPCPHCAKVYRRKRERDLHSDTCRILSEDVSEKEVELRQDTMTHQQLCDTVKVLVKKQTKLEAEVKTLKSQLATIRKKVTVEEYLSRCVHPTNRITQFGLLLKVSSDDFSELLDGKLDTVLESIIARAVPSIEEVPLRTFTGNGGTVYCYGDDGLWRKTNTDDWTTMSGVIKKSLLEQLKRWTDTNERRLGDDSFSLRYHTYVQKIMCCIPRIQPRFTALLCQRVKVSLNGVTTFEFKLS